MNEVRLRECYPLRSMFPASVTSASCASRAGRWRATSHTKYWAPSSVVRQRRCSTSLSANRLHRNPPVRHRRGDLPGSRPKPVNCASQTRSPARPLLLLPPSSSAMAVSALDGHGASGCLGDRDRIREERVTLLSAGLLGEHVNVHAVPATGRPPRLHPRRPGPRGHPRCPPARAGRCRRPFRRSPGPLHSGRRRVAAALDGALDGVRVIVERGVA